MTDKETIEQLEKDLAICRRTVEKLSKENSALRQEVGVVNEDMYELGQILSSSSSTSFKFIALKPKSQH